jgi:TonB-dependent receptor
LLLSRKTALHSAIGLIFWSQLALPTTQVYSFSIPSNTLSAALNAWAKVTNRDFISSPDTLRNIQAPALEGIFSGIAAIDALLINTNLKYKEQADGSILIYIKPLAISPTDKLPTEEILVTGIRGSLRRALEVKRDATNIVDAISSLDISKFPDTNLAEALQRITGVSIDRINNEGNKVTVRGLGPNFNLVTLNGRHMPVTAIPEISSLNSLAPATRSFEFINVSADSIDSVEVHKTVQANDLSGGIGATLDIKTHRPLLDTPKFFSLGIKNVFDTTTTDKPTQEISTAFNQTLSDNTFGVFFSGIFQERNSTIEEAHINGWVGESTAFSEWYSQNNFEVSNLLTEDLKQNSVGLSWAPLSHYFSTSEIIRQRKNAQLTLQYAPSEKIQSTLDINYQGFKASPKTQQFGTNFFGIPRDKLFGENLTSSINQNGTTTILTKKDAIYHFQKSEEQFINKTKSLGVNINYLFSNELNFTFDAHSAHAQAQRLIKNLQVLELSASAINFNANYDIPSMTIELNDPFTAKNLTTITEPQAYTTFQQSMKNQITQFRFQGDFDNHGNEWFSNLKFGIDRIEEDNHASVHEDIFETHWNLNFEFLPENSPRGSCRGRPRPP